jgi:hypothetical protein
VAAFFEGGITYSELAAMPLSEFFEIVECANKIAEERKKKMERR